MAMPSTAAVSPHTVDNPAVPSVQVRAPLCLCARVEGFSGPPSPDLSRAGFGVLSAFRRDARAADLTTVSVAALFALRFRTTTLPSLPCAHKELLFCVVVGTSLSSCLSCLCSCGCLLSFSACCAPCLPGVVLPFLWLVGLSPVLLPLAWPLFLFPLPLLSLFLLFSSPALLSPSSSSFGSWSSFRRWPRLVSRSSASLSGSSVRLLLLLLGVGGRRVALLSLLPVSSLP